MKTIKKRRIEITTFERERFVRQRALVHCPTCGTDTEMLTTRQAAELVQIRPQSIRRWLARGNAHGMRTSGGSHRVCRNSLFISQPGNPVAEPTPDNDLDYFGQTLKLEPIRSSVQEPAQCD